MRYCNASILVGKNMFKVNNKELQTNETSFRLSAPYKENIAFASHFYLNAVIQKQGKHLRSGIYHHQQYNFHKYLCIFAFKYTEIVLIQGWKELADEWY